MRFAISLFVLIAILGTSAKQQIPKKAIMPVCIKPLPLHKVVLAKPSDNLMRALKELDYKSSVCSRSVNKILKSKKDSLSLVANRN
jgi:hypothetical protein